MKISLREVAKKSSFLSGPARPIDFVQMCHLTKYFVLIKSCIFAISLKVYFANAAKFREKNFAQEKFRGIPTLYVPGPKDRFANIFATGGLLRF